MIDSFRIFLSELEAVFGPDRPATYGELIDLVSSVYGSRK